MRRVETFVLLPVEAEMSVPRSRGEVGAGGLVRYVCCASKRGLARCVLLLHLPGDARDLHPGAVILGRAQCCDSH